MTESGLFKAGRILVLVGAIMSVAAAVFLLIATLGLAAFGQLASEAEADTAVAGIVTVVYGIIALLTAVGAVFGFLSFASARRGDVHQAWIRGLVAALLPPVQLLLLVGAILILVSPEHEAEQNA